MNRWLLVTLAVALSLVLRGCAVAEHGTPPPDGGGAAPSPPDGGRTALPLPTDGIAVPPLPPADFGTAPPPPDADAERPPFETGAEVAVARVVDEFGRRLQMVPLLAPADVVHRSLQENYGDLVAPALLAEWLLDPHSAPGRLTSSPWPDRIEIRSLAKREAGGYEVQADIIEVTSVEAAGGGAAARRPITLVVEKIGPRWQITAVQLGPYAAAGAATVYQNTAFGFRFALPPSWQGHQVVMDRWEGRAVTGPQSGEIVAKGPMVVIRHPDWTAAAPRQDIPIMVLTVDQWHSLQEGEFHIGAAPIGPKELGRNTRYVFALPARYNYAFLPGYEEVEAILAGDPLQATAVGLSGGAGETGD